MSRNAQRGALKIALLAGGISSEREISLSSGASVQAVLREQGYSVTCIDPANKADLIRLIQDEFDIAFLCTHGKGGEDGCIQGFLECIGLPYTGSGVYASAVAMNKISTKAIFESNGIPTPRSWQGEAVIANLEAVYKDLGPKCVVKAPSEGSSIGLHIIDTFDDFCAAVDEVSQLGDGVLVEEFIAGKEYTVAVLGNEDPIALPVIEIVPKNDFYDFESKYAQGGSEHICPAQLSEEATDEMKDLAIRAHKRIGCRGVSRIDFIVDELGNPWALEINTLPGMTATSLVPDAARVAGIGFGQLCKQLIELALEQ